MRVLIETHKFYPSLGGSETNAEILAREFVKFGHEVKIVTNSSGGIRDSQGEIFPFQVIRSPNVLALISLLEWCDVCLQNGFLLRQFWALVLTQTPLVIRHHTWLPSNSFFRRCLNFIKLFCIRQSISISVSRSIALHFAPFSRVISNPYRDDQFRLIPEAERTKELVFLGRLVKSKGGALLLEALASLKDFSLFPKLTVIGTGEQEAELKQQTIDLKLSDQVIFAGAKEGGELAQFLNEHHILVVPSVWQEPFAVVALEGIACGCVIVGSEGGGLKDAIGPCGVTFPNGDVQALTKVLAELLQHPETYSQYHRHASEHLAKHRKELVAQAYLEVLEEAVQKSKIRKFGFNSLLKLFGKWPTIKLLARSNTPE